LYSHPQWFYNGDNSRIFLRETSGVITVRLFENHPAQGVRPDRTEECRKLIFPSLFGAGGKAYAGNTTLCFPESGIDGGVRDVE
jgi:hypothetical protein